MRSFFKLLFGASLIGVLLLQLDFSELGSTLKKTNYQILALAILFYFLAALAEVTRLHVLLRTFCNFLQTARLVFIGFFFNNFLPTNIGGDIYKVVGLRALNVNTDRGVTYVLFDRAVGLAVLLLLGAIYSLLNAELFFKLASDARIAALPSWLLPAFFVAILALFALVAALFHSGLRRYIQVVSDRFKRLVNIASEFGKRDLITQISVVTIFHGVRLLAIYCIVISLGEFIVWHGLIFVLTTVAIFSALPISFGGLGVREGVLAGGLIFLGVSTNAAISTALINLAYLWTKGLIGGLVFLLTRNDAKNSRSAGHLEQ